ncbi:MAG: phosphate ABC transporter permease subunit PstC [Oscillospiraceae bacterium]|nr:phosphate ABC transporter permease subunit PstC [Oscillospiraceae bacterium]
MASFLYILAAMPGIVAFIEMIVYFAISREQFDRRYNWKHLGLPALHSKWVHEYLGRGIVTVFGVLIILVTLTILGFLGYKGSATFLQNGHSLADFLFSAKWAPSEAGQSGTVGAAVFIVGSLEVSGLALLLATPFALAVAVFMNDISAKLGKRFLRPVVEIFVGIPSVVYGWIGLTVLVPFIAHFFAPPPPAVLTGFSVLAAAIVLAVMIFPTITSVATDALGATPMEYKEASYALGSTRWQMIWKVSLRSARPGILTGVVLGLARAFGEALAVAMVIGQSNRFASGLLSPTNTITAVITANMGNTVTGSEYNNALWSLAFLLLLISLVFIVAIRVIGKQRRDA